MWWRSDIYAYVALTWSKNGIILELFYHRNLSIARWSDICDIDFWEKWRCFGKCFQAKGSSVAHSLYYIVYIYKKNSVGRSIASISHLGGKFTLGLLYWL